MPKMSSNFPSTIVFFVISAESLRIAKASNNLNHSLLQLNYLLPIGARRDSPMKKEIALFWHFLTNIHDRLKMFVKVIKKC